MNVCTTRMTHSPATGAEPQAAPGAAGTSSPREPSAVAAADRRDAYEARPPGGAPQVEFHRRGATTPDSPGRVLPRGPEAGARSLLTARALQASDTARSTGGTEEAPRVDGRQYGRTPGAYDEMIDERDRVRPLYRDIWPIIETLTPERRAAALEASRAPFLGHYEVDPVPRLLTRADTKLLRAGVQQRGTALRMFLQDHHSGEKRYRAFLSPEKVDAVIDRFHERGYIGRIDPSEISFPYGPDIMRDRDGKFFIIEDNIGFLGGMADLEDAREALYQGVPAYRGVLKGADRPMAFYEGLVAEAKKRAHPAGGEVVLYTGVWNHLSERLAKVFDRLGVPAVSAASAAKLSAGPDGVFLVSRSADGEETRRQVGFILFAGEHRWVDASHPASAEALLLTAVDFVFAARGPDDPYYRALHAAATPDPKTGRVDLAAVERLLVPEYLAENWREQNSPLPGLMDALFNHKVGIDFAPGTSWVSDKDLKGDVDEMVRFYLGEEPIIPSIPVTRFTTVDANGEEIRDEAAIERLLGGEAYKEHVFKAVAGRGGSGVYIGPKMTPAEVDELRAKIRAEPSLFVAEPFKQLSTLDGHIVDLRLLSQIGPKDSVIASTPWGRGVPLGGDGKVNLSRNGKEFAVFVAPK